MKKTYYPAANLLILGFLFALGYLLSTLVFKTTGDPPEIWRHVVSGYIALFGFGILHASFRKANKNDSLIENIFSALCEISQGDFNVFVEKDDAAHIINVDALVDQINKMAKDLNSMEHMRQDFISNVSHEIRSPLTSIGGYAALLRQGASSPEQIEFARMIEDESKRLSKLSDNLLLLSILEDENMTLEKDSFRLDQQIVDVALLLEPQWTSKKITLNVSLSKTIFFGNQDLLKQVWINLLVNAIKFTPENGTISILLKTKASHVLCQIADTGIGIAAADQLHIFERFYKADRARSRSLGGNGLGLSLVKKIIELHHGSITVESALGQGSTFTVTLLTSNE